MNKVKFSLSSISNGLLDSSVNHNSIYQNSKLYVFQNMKFVDEISKICPNDLFEINP